MEISFILVEPKVPENIGASARAIKTMGFNSLKIVKPPPDPEGRSFWLAHGSSDILDGAYRCSSLEEAISGSDMVIATTARKRSIKQDLIRMDELKSFILDSGHSRISIVFGREESGLTNDEVKLCDVASYIPMALKYPSLNLGQAVMLYAYALANKSDGSKPDSDNNPADDDDNLKALKPKIDLILNETGISKNKNLAGRIVERIGLAGSKDIKLIHSVASAIINTLRIKSDKE